MKTLYNYRSYRQYLQDHCAKDTAKRGAQSQLAKAAGCQAAYFSQVLKQRVHLTEDQIISIAENLELTTDETRFIVLLLRYEKAGTLKLRNYLNQEMAAAIACQNKLSSRVDPDQIVHSELDLAKYFSSWIPSAVHLITSSEKFRTVEKISEKLHLPKTETKEILNFLVKMGWVQKRNSDYHYAGGNIHVAKDSPLQSAMQSTRRHLALNSIAVNLQSSVHYSSLFTISRESYDELNSLVADFVQKSAKVIQKSGTDELCCICLDLFQVP
jgi:uncharacterized protein (TIGR02147 family)